MCLILNPKPMSFRVFIAMLHTSISHTKLEIVDKWSTTALNQNLGVKEIIENTEFDF